MTGIADFAPATTAWPQQAPTIAVGPQPDFWTQPDAPSASQLPPVQIRRPIKRAKRQRKRHIPVGPAGLWFQQQQASSSSSTTSASATQQQNPEQPLHTQNQKDEEEDIDEGDGVLGRLKALAAAATENSQNNNNSNNSSSFYSPAWMAMQVDLQLVTPSLPISTNMAQKLRALRPHLNPHGCLLLADLGGLGSTTAQMAATSGNNRKWYLVVLVQAIYQVNDVWTVVLTDETGIKRTAWIQHKLVTDEEQRTSPRYLQVGYVWQLQWEWDDDDDGDRRSNINPNSKVAAVSLLSNRSTRTAATGSGGRADRDDAEGVAPEGHLLQFLVKEENILHVWTPAHAEQVSDQAYISWMERRNSLQSGTGQHISVPVKSPLTTNRNTDNPSEPECDQYEYDSDEHSEHEFQLDGPESTLCEAALDNTTMNFAPTPNEPFAVVTGTPAPPSSVTNGPPPTVQATTTMQPQNPYLHPKRKTESRTDALHSAIATRVVANTPAELHAGSRSSPPSTHDFSQFTLSPSPRSAPISKRKSPTICAPTESLPIAEKPRPLAVVEEGGLSSADDKSSNAPSAAKKKSKSRKRPKRRKGSNPEKRVKETMKLSGLFAVDPKEGFENEDDAVDWESGDDTLAANATPFNPASQVLKGLRLSNPAKVATTSLFQLNSLNDDADVDELFGE